MLELMLIHVSKTGHRLKSANEKARIIKSHSLYYKFAGKEHLSSNLYYDISSFVCDGISSHG